MKKWKRKSVNPPSPFLSRPTPAPYFHPLFLIFKFHPPLGEVIKIYPPPFKKWGVGGSKLCLLLQWCSDKILKCCNIYQSFSQIPSQKTVHDENKSWTHYLFSPIIWLSKAKYIASCHHAPWYFLFLSVNHREAYLMVYLKAFQSHMSLPSLVSYWN